MIRKLFLQILLHCISISIYGQRTILKKVHHFFPKDHVVEDFKLGYINADTLIDIAVVLKHKNELIQDSINIKERNRPLIIFLQTPKKSFTKFKTADSLILCQICGGMFGDPYSGMEIKDQLILLHFYGGSRYRWTRDLEFKYDKKTNNLILVRDDEGSYDALNLDTDYVNKPHFDIRKDRIFIDKYVIKWD